MFENPFLKTQEHADAEDPRDELITLWDLYADGVPGNLQEVLQQRRTRIQEVEENIDKKELGWLLWRYGVKNTKVERDQNGRYQIQVKNHFHNARLPKGYGYKGGAARALLLRNLGVDPEARPRDIDLVRFSAHEPEPGMDRYLESIYMPEDLETGYGVEEFKDDYFDTRDFTVNQVLATDSAITATRACLLDTLRHVLRVTDYEKRKFRGIGPKMLAKLIRFYAESIIKFEQTHLAKQESETLNSLIDDPFISSFWIALQLDRSSEISEEVAEKFVSECIKLGLLPKTISGAGEAAEYLLQDICDFEYRHAPVGQREMEDRWYEQEKMKYAEPFEKKERRRKRRKSGK